MWRRACWALLLACGSQTQQTQVVDEPEPESETAEVVPREDPPTLPEIPDPEPVEWPERFLGKTIAELLADQTLMALYRDEDGHRAHEIELVPIDDTSGWVVDRGVVMSPDYSTAPYERWSRVMLRNGELVISTRVGRSEATEARSQAREARYDAVRAHFDACNAGCDDAECSLRCGDRFGVQLFAPHRFSLGDARVVIDAPDIRIEWGEEIELDIPDTNVNDEYTRPTPLFARVRRDALSSDRDALVIRYGHHCDEDAYCATTRVFVRVEGRVVELEGGFGDARDVELPGDGTIRWVDGDMRMCEPTARQRAAHLASVDPDMADPDLYWWHQRREIRMSARVADGGSVTEMPARPQPWGACTGTFAAACPYVDIITEQGTTRVGEILRWVRDEPGTQGLALPTLSGERVRIRLAEEKPETTYLDAVWLELDGERVDPLQPMAPDGRYEVMQRGDAIELTFPLRPHTSARLVAVGYYVVRASMAR